MTPQEILARYLCEDAGFHPDGTYGDDPTKHWESFKGAADSVINSFRAAGYDVVPMERIKPW